MKMRRLLSFLLALVMTLSLLPMGVWATEQDNQESSGSATIPFQLNPLYEGLVDEEALIRAYEAQAQEEEDDSTLGQESEALAAPTYHDPATAAVQLRTFMKARAKNVKIYVASPREDYEEMLYEIIDDSLCHTGNPIEGDYLMWQYGGWSGDAEWEKVNGSYNYCYTLTFYYYTSADQERQMDTAVANLLSALNVRSKSDYEKIRTVYDYVCANVTYDYEHLYDENYTLQYTAYGALIDKTAVCQGYAVLMYRLLLDLGVDARLIAGQSFGENHGWNIAKLGNVYYHLDSTWDAGMEEYGYFLTNVPNFQDHTRFPEYETTAFHMAYPMSATDYVPGVEGEPEWAFARGECGGNAYWAVDRGQNLTISGTGATDNFRMEEESVPWYNWNDGFSNVKVEEGITSLGKYIFYNADHIQSVTLPQSLTVVDPTAFYGCDGLTQLTVPANVTIFGIRNCPNLKSITFQGKAPVLDSQAFSGITATVYYPAGDPVWNAVVRGQYGGRITWVAYAMPTADATPMYRLYNPNSGEHFYTSSMEERTHLIQVGWRDEGIAWNAPTKSGDPVYRLYNPNAGDHHYTMSAQERDMLVGVGWKYEGVAWNSADPKVGNPLYRLYNPNADCGSHHYTGSVPERDILVQAGWIYEGIGWYGMP